MNLKKTYLFLIIGLIIGLILGIAISYSNLKFYPEYKQKSELRNYKKILVDSVVCEYNCPLSEQNNSGKSVLLPSNECVKTCTDQILDLPQKYSNEDLNDDGFIDEIQLIIDQCKISSTQNYEINNSLYFPCNAQKIELLKEKYSYLK